MLRQAARARLITTANRQVSIPVSLRYDPADPLAVHIVFPPLVSLDGKNITWYIARELLAEGLRQSAGIGDVRIWPCGRAHTVMEFHAPGGSAVAKFDTPALHRFLVRSYVLVARGREVVEPALDERLAALLDEV